MKKYRIDVDKMNGYQTLRYQLQVADVYDSSAADRARNTQVQGLMQLQYIDVDGRRSLMANVPDFPTLSSYIQKMMRKQEVLTIVRNLIAATILTYYDVLTRCVCSCCEICNSVVVDIC